MTRTATTVYQPFQRLPVPRGGVGGEGILGVAGAVGFCIAPAGGDELPGEDPAATDAPGAEGEDDCQKTGVVGEGRGARGVTCGVELTGNTIPELLPPAPPAGSSLVGVNDSEEEEGAKDGVEEDGVMLIPL